MCLAYLTRPTLPTVTYLFHQFLDDPGLLCNGLGKLHDALGSEQFKDWHRSLYLARYPVPHLLRERYQ